MINRGINNLHIENPAKIHNRKYQAALDYLMSWGWVLIIIVLALVILYSLGVFHIPAAPTIISGFKGITMQAAEANSTMMVVKITNNYNQFINITGVTVNIGGNSYTSYSCLDTIISTGQSTLCRVPVSIKTTSYLSNVQISFTPYKSQIYEVSNGTVSSTLVSGSIPINNQLTYFIEKGLPYGSTFTVTYNTSTNSTVVSSTAQNVSFDLPFGDYQFSVPEVIYQGCSSIPSPTSGVHSTGVEQIIQFTSNCTTTFSETGLPSGQTWQVYYNGSTVSNSTGNSIKIDTNNTKNAQLSYTAVAKSGNLACVSYNNPSVSLSSSYTFSSWTCTTTFSESGLPSGYTWTVSYDGSSGSASTGSSIPITQNSITTVSSYTATATVSDLSCSSSISAQQGSAVTFSSWTCTTTFSESGLSSGDSWNVSFADTTKSSTGSTITFTTEAGSSSWSSSAQTSFLGNCPTTYSSPSGSANYGSSVSVSFSSSTECTTTFYPTNLNSGYTWSITYGGITKSADTSNSITFITDNPSPAFNYNASIDGLNCNSSGAVSGGQDVSLEFLCYTTFNIYSINGCGISWSVTYGGITESQSGSDSPGTACGDSPIVFLEAGALEGGKLPYNSSFSIPNVQALTQCAKDNHGSLLTGSSFSTWYGYRICA